MALHVAWLSFLRRLHCVGLMVPLILPRALLVFCHFAGDIRRYLQLRDTLEFFNLALAEDRLLVIVCASVFFETYGV